MLLNWFFYLFFRRLVWLFLFMYNFLLLLYWFFFSFHQGFHAPAISIFFLPVIPVGIIIERMDKYCWFLRYSTFTVGKSRGQSAKNFKLSEFVLRDLKYLEVAEFDGHFLTCW